MPERKVVILLGERDLQAIEQAVLDKDGPSALEFLRGVLCPRIEEVMKRPHCKPEFEWGGGMEPPSGPPDRA